MSRFSPDTWLDAIQLPFAMVQFKGSVYVEPIAPDLRPAACIALVLGAFVASLVRVLRKKKSYDGPSEPNHRAAWALITATLLALVSWIFTSGNGRYGLAAITLTPLAGLAALLILTRSRRARFFTLSIIIFVQTVFLLTADPDDTWSKLTSYNWTERYADRLPSKVIEPWKDDAIKRSTLVVTSKTLTGMSTLYQVFGPKAHYMGLGYLDQYTTDTIEYRRAILMVDAAEVVYLSRAVAADPAVSDSVTTISSPLTIGERQRLRRFGLVPMENARCSLLPERMGAQLQICPLIKATPHRIDPVDLLPQAPLRLLDALGKKCPGILNDARQPISDDAGGILTSVHDGKYFLDIRSNLDVYIRHRSEVGSRLLLSGKSTGQLNQISCASMINAGWQYWR